MGNYFHSLLSSAPQCTAEIISPKDLYNIQQNLFYHYQIIDFRSVEEFLSSHIDLAVHIDSKESFFHSPYFDSYNALIIYGNCDDTLITKLFMKLISNEIKAKVFVLDDYTSYQSRYPFLCTDNGKYKEGQLYPSEINENVYLCNLGVATNVDVLKAIGITHVVNCTPNSPFATKVSSTERELDDSSLSQVETLQTLRIPIVDDADENIGNISHPNSLLALCKRCTNSYQYTLWTEKYFSSSVNFIRDAIESSEQNKVLVHCKHGQSRSASIVAAWLIATQGMTVEEAITYLKSCRPKVNPNLGFRMQLDTFYLSIHTVPIAQKSRNWDSLYFN